MFTLDVKADVQPIIRKLNALKDGIGDKVIVAALNETIAQTKTAMARAIGDEYNLKQGEIKDRLPVRRASRKGQWFEATLIGNPAGRAKRALNLVHFLQKGATIAAYRRKGTVGRDVLRFRIKRGGGLVSIPGTFVLNVPGNPVFKRTGTGRKAIAPAYMIGIPQMFQAHKIQDPITAAIPRKFNDIFDRRMRYFISTIGA